MEQLFFFTDLQSIEYAELEGLIDPKLDADFLEEVGKVFAGLTALDDDIVEVGAA